MKLRTYTPLRYPGGKVRLYSYVKKLIEKNYNNPPIYIEAFAGGSGLALKLLMTNIVSEIYINDYDYAIYCIWHSIKYHNKKFKELIKNAVFSIEEWNKQKEIYLDASKKSNYSKLEIGFATFYLNRTNRSGIITAGPIGGNNQNGNYLMDCRFNKEELLNIISKIHKYKSKIHVYSRDAYKFIQQMECKIKSDCFYYLDPPYVQKGPGLYKNSFDKEKHMQLKNSVLHLKNKWLITYDYDPFIEKLYSNYHMKEFHLSYSAQKAKLGKEYAIYSNNLIDVGEIKIVSKIK